MDFSQITIEEAREFLMYNGVRELSTDIFTVQSKAAQVYRERSQTGNVVYTLICLALDRAARFPSNDKYTESQIVNLTLNEIQAFGQRYQFDWTTPYAKQFLWRILELQNNVITTPVVIPVSTVINTPQTFIPTMASVDSELQNKIKTIFDKIDKLYLELFVKQNDKKNFINVDMSKFNIGYLRDKAVELFMYKYKNGERIIDVGDWNLKSIIIALKHPSATKYTDLQIDNLNSMQIDELAKFYSFKRSLYDNNPKESNTKEFIKSILYYQGNLVKTY